MALNVEAIFEAYVHDNLSKCFGVHYSVTELHENVIKQYFETVTKIQHLTGRF